VAVAGSYFVQTEELHWEAFALAVPVGSLAAAILLVNNIRDADTDRRAGKRTLAVRLGRDRARRLYLASVILAFAAPPIVAAASGHWLVCAALLALPLAVPVVRTVMTRSDGPGLNDALAKTGMLLAVFAVLLAAGLLAS
jgi:1,4-dihydroxy-2-naphthoate polyprenyltransferase